MEGAASIVIHGARQHWATSLQHLSEFFFIALAHGSPPALLVVAQQIICQVRRRLPRIRRAVFPLHQVLDAGAAILFRHHADPFQIFDFDDLTARAHYKGSALG